MGDDGDGQRFKVIVTGDYCVGKTSLIRRYCDGVFSTNYRLTIGVDFAVKDVPVNNGRVVRADVAASTLVPDSDLDSDSGRMPAGESGAEGGGGATSSVSVQVWDVAGHERFGKMTRVYYRQAVGAAIVFDLTRPATFEAVAKWHDDLRSKVQLPNGDPIPVLLIGNKCDLPGRAVTRKQGEQLARERRLAGYVETSAAEDVGVTEAMATLVDCVLALDSAQVRQHTAATEGAVRFSEMEREDPSGEGRRRGRKAPGDRTLLEDCCL